MGTRNITMTAKIKGVIEKIFPVTLASNVLYGDNSTVAQEISDLKKKGNNFPNNAVAKTDKLGLYNIEVDEHGFVTKTVIVDPSELGGSVGSGGTTSFEAKHTFVKKTINPSDWSDSVYNLETEYPGSRYNIYLTRGDDITLEQSIALSNAMITSNISENKFKCLGTVPTITIPVILEVVDLQDEVTKEKQHKFISKTIKPDEWVNGTLDLSNAYPNNKFNIYLSLGENITVEQINAFKSAIIKGSITTNIYKCLGTVPTIEIPVILEVVEK